MCCKQLPIDISKAKVSDSIVRTYLPLTYTMVDMLNHKAYTNSHNENVKLLITISNLRNIGEY